MNVIDELYRQTVFKVIRFQFYILSNYAFDMFINKMIFTIIYEAFELTGKMHISLWPFHVHCEYRPLSVKIA